MLQATGYRLQAFNRRFFYTFLLAFLISNCGLVRFSFALPLDRLKTHFLSGDYKSAIAEGEKILASQKSQSESDELYYFLGLSYLKDGKYLRASDIFEIILSEFKESAFKEQAELGLGDAYFFLADYDRAKRHYRGIVDTNPRSKLCAAVYYRLAQVALKKGDTQSTKEHFEKLKTDFPNSPEARLSNEIYSGQGIFYTVQVGSFSSPTNAQNLAQKLSQKGYPAYVEESRKSDGRKTYRVRVGKFQLRQEAVDFEQKLSQEGYPTKLFP